MKYVDLIKLKMAAFSAIIHFHTGGYLVNRARWLDHYYKAKCEFSGEDAPRNFLTYEFKMDEKQHYLP